MHWADKNNIMNIHATRKYSCCQHWSLAFSHAYSTYLRTFIATVSQCVDDVGITETAPAKTSHSKIYSHFFGNQKVKITEQKNKNGSNSRRY